MPGHEEQRITCRGCGQQYAAALGSCPACGQAGGTAEMVVAGPSDWTRARDSLKTKWVVAVIAFWVSAAVLLAVFLIDDRLDPILLSIALGMLFIGMWLKARYQLHLRKDPMKQ
jgi:hypothetical protein